MKNLTYILAFLYIGWSASASENTSINTSNFYNDSYIFVEDGVEFAVYPNGEFDFYFNPQFRSGNSVNISTPNVNISYNSGYNYEPYVQYDDYGAVIQIESVPVYYDYYGRIVQAGDIFISYNNYGRIARVGNMHIHYDHFNHFSHATGFINPFNRHYVYRPWHSYYRRPAVNVSIVYGRPYRAYYQPHRYSYNQYVTVYNNYYSNHSGRRNFYRPTDRISKYNYGSRTSQKRDLRNLRTRNSNDISASRQRVARSKEVRNSSVRDYNNNRSKTYSSRSDRKTNTRTSENRVKTFSGRTERSSNARGRSATINNNPQQKRQETRQRSSNVSKPRADVKRNTQNRSGNARSTQAPTRNRSVRNSGNIPERKSQVERQTRQRSSSVRNRTSGSRSGSINAKNSSRTRSSARNMNNNK